MCRRREGRMELPTESLRGLPKATKPEITIPIGADILQTCGAMARIVFQVVTDILLLVRKNFMQH